LSKCKSHIIETPRSKRKTTVELFNCTEEYLKTVKKVICIHPANHSIALFLKMKENADLCLYCHPLLADIKAKEYVISYVGKYNFPLVILTREEEIEELFKENGCPTMWRRWCSRMFKIEPTRLFYKNFIPSGVIEYMGMQKFQSKERSDMNPELSEDAKSQKRYKIYSELPIFYESEEDNTKRIEAAGIKPYESRGYNRYGCYLCPFAGIKYYEQMKVEKPELYERCNKLMQLGSEEGKRYYYYRKTKIM